MAYIESQKIMILRAEKLQTHILLQHIHLRTEYRKYISDNILYELSKSAHLGKSFQILGYNYQQDQSNNIIEIRIRNFQYERDKFILDSISPMFEWGSYFIINQDGKHIRWNFHRKMIVEEIDTIR